MVLCAGEEVVGVLACSQVGVAMDWLVCSTRKGKNQLGVAGGESCATSPHESRGGKKMWDDRSWLLRE